MQALKDLDPNIVLLALVGLVAVAVIAIAGRRLSVTVGNVHAELTPNGGSSMRDAIDRIERDLTETRDRVAALEQARPTATAIVVQPPAPEPAG